MLNRVIIVGQGKVPRLLAAEGKRGGESSSTRLSSLRYLPAPVVCSSRDGHERPRQGVRVEPALVVYDVHE